MKNNKQIDIEGIDAVEHFIDMFKEIDLMYDNIKENTDNAFEILKIYENNKDQESVDVLRITCSDILDCEQIIKNQFVAFNNLRKEILGNIENLEIEKAKDKVDEFYNLIKKQEKESSSQFKKLLKFSSAIK